MPVSIVMVLILQENHFWINKKLNTHIWNEIVNDLMKERQARKSDSKKKQERIKKKCENCLIKYFG